MFQCPNQPNAPDPDNPNTSDKDIAIFIDRLATAGNACRIQLGETAQQFLAQGGEIIDAPPVEDVKAKKGIAGWFGLE